MTSSDAEARRVRGASQRISHPWRNQMKFTKCPPGTAQGVDDLEQWSVRRAGTRAPKRTTYGRAKWKRAVSDKAMNVAKREQQSLERSRWKPSKLIPKNT
jgi:hypothetical protein